MLINLIQEGIGALITFLPSKVGLVTLRDFLAIMIPQAQKIKQDAQF